MSNAIRKRLARFAAAAEAVAEKAEQAKQAAEVAAQLAAAAHEDRIQEEVALRLAAMAVPAHAVAPSERTPLMDAIAQAHAGG